MCIVFHFFSLFNLGILNLPNKHNNSKIKCKIQPSYYFGLFKIHIGQILNEVSVFGYIAQQVGWPVAYRVLSTFC